MNLKFDLHLAPRMQKEKARLFFVQPLGSREARQIPEGKGWLYEKMCLIEFGPGKSAVDMPRHLCR
jgi:hypothetical protein